MIQELRDKLESELAKNTKKQEWCVTEQDKSKKSKVRLEMYKQKISDRLEEMNANKDQLDHDLKSAGLALEEANDGLTEQRKERETQGGKAKKEIGEYKEAHTLLNNAISVLKGSLDKAARSVAIGLMEIAAA